MMRLVSSPLTPCAEPAMQEQWKGTGQCQRPQLLMLPTAVLLLLQKPILLSSTTCLVLGPSSFVDTTRAATSAKEQQHQALQVCDLSHSEQHPQGILVVRGFAQLL